MKKQFPLTKTYGYIILVLVFLIISPSLFSQNIGVNVSGATPSKNAILDLNTGNPKNLGLLVPRVVLGSITTVFNPPMANAPTGLDSGMMVFNWQATNQPIGYYFWNGASWISVSSGGSITGANDGTSISGTNVILGSNFGSLLGKLTQNTEIPFNGNNLTFSNVGGGGTLGIDLPASTSAAQALEIGQTTNTIRIDGLGTGNAFNAAPSSSATYMMYANANGDMYSIPAGAINTILAQTATGPAWGALPAGSITANNALNISAVNNVQLGGLLIQNTAVGLATFSLTFDNGTFNLNNTLGGTTNIGTGGTGNVTIGNNSAAANAVNITSGNTGAVNINNAIASPTNINTGSTGVVDIGNNTGMTGVNNASPQSTLDVNGSFGTTVSAVLTANTTLTNTNSTVLVNPNGGAFTVTLPAPGAANARRIYTIIFDPSTATTNLVTITSATANTIIASGTLALTSFTINGGSVTLQSNGTDWYVLSGNVFDVPIPSSGFFFDLSNATYYTAPPSNGFALDEMELVAAIGGANAINSLANLQAWTKAISQTVENVGTLAAPSFTMINTDYGNNIAYGTASTWALNFVDYTATTTCRLNSVNLYLVYNNIATAVTVDVEVYDYPAASNNNVNALTGGVAIASNNAISIITTAGNQYNAVIPGNGTVVKPGDMIIVWVRLIGGTTGNLMSYTGSMQFQSFQ